jgi:pyruvate dehydrogenase E1 component alpha subunit
MYWMGSEWGSHFPENVRVLPICAPVGTQTLHGVGLAWAAKLRRESRVVLIYFGDGATSKGDFHEAMNFAGVFQTPCVFFCQNNQYAISVPRTIQTAAATLAQKAIAYGFPGVIVDGNDLLAVYATTQAAVAHARSGAGPVFLEAQTYRLGPHTTADDPSRYRTEEELQAQQQHDPLLRLRRYLEKQGLLTEAAEQERLARYQAQVREVAKQAEAAMPRNLDDIFAYHYATLPPYLAWQRDYLRRIVADRGEPGHG